MRRPKLLQVDATAHPALTEYYIPYLVGGVAQWLGRRSYNNNFKKNNNTKCI